MQTPKTQLLEPGVAEGPMTRGSMVERQLDPGSLDGVHLAAELTEGAEHELERDIAVIRYYKRPWWRLVLTWILGVLTGGIVWLVCLWSLAFRTALTLSPAAVQDAQFVYIELRDKRSSISNVEVLHAPTHQASPIRYFTFHTVRFIYSPVRGVFEAVPNVAPALSREMVTARRAVGAGLTPGSQPQQIRQRRELQYGRNLLHVPSPSFWIVFAHDALQPFCCFQYLSVVVWSLEGYYTYSVIVFAITLASVITNSVSQYQERRRMAELAHYVCDVELVIGEADKLGPSAHILGVGPHGHPLVPSSSLTPGDVVVVGTGKVAYDGVLLEGETVMDETVLTGESIPVRKAAYDPELDGGAYNPDTFNHCTLFNGTIVSAVRGGRAGRPALAIVASTGFNTAKGRLLRTIMFPRPHDLHFIKQAMYFILLMFVMAMAFYIWDVVAMLRFGVPGLTIALKAFDMITTAVPPALACCLAIATTISVMRLKKHNVYVLDNERVAVAGLLDAICFDKTGTLTESGLELGGVVPVKDGRVLPQVPDPQSMDSIIRELFAACHGLTQLGGTVVGDPLDQRLFEASGYEMKFQEEPPPDLMPIPGNELPRADLSKAPTGTVGDSDGQGVGVDQKGEEAARSGDAALGGSGGMAGLVQAVQAAGPFLVLRQRRPPPADAPSSDSPEQLTVMSRGHSALLPSTVNRSDDPQHQQSHYQQGDDAPLHRKSLTRHSVSEVVGALTRQLSPTRWLGDQSAARQSLDRPSLRTLSVARDIFDPEEAIHVIRRFDFSSERLRSTAVVRRHDGRLVVFTKGSPEKLLTLMDPSSVPHDFTEALQAYTNQGLRVIAMACRELTGLAHPSEVLAMSQDALEAGTQLLGLVLMVNKLKPESAPAIEHLHRACIRTAMVTGDHVRTAVTVARQCAIMNGQTPALVIDVERGTLHEADFKFEVMAGEEGKLPLGMLFPTTLNTTSTSAEPPPTSNSEPPQSNGSNHLHTVSNGDSAPATAVGGGAGSGIDLQGAMRAAAGGQVQVAVTGRAWQKANLEPEHHDQLLDIMLQRGTVFARMNPEDKAQLIQQLGFGEVDATGQMRHGCGYYTGYCGDGANDLGALKGALVGVSLCDAEASIAAPMTSRTPHVGVMITVIAEGRCSLVTSIIIFKYTMVYAYIQVLALALLYNMGLTVGNYQYLIQDLFHTTLLASCMGLTGPASTLSRERPLGRVLSAGVILPVAAQMLVDTIVQLIALGLLYRQSWYTPYDGADPINIPVSEKRWENGVLMIIVSWQLVINALVFNVGYPFRKGLWTNPWLLASLLGLIGFNLYVTWAPSDPFKAVVPAVTEMPLSFRAVLFVVACINLAVAYLADWLARKTYRAGKLYMDRRSSRTKQQRRLQGGPLGLPAQTPPTMQLSHAMSGAADGLLATNNVRSTPDLTASANV